MADLKISGLTKKYKNGIVAVEDFSLDVKDGEFIVIVGPSGCGKSTILRMIAGLEKSDLGSIYLGERRLDDVDTKDRDIAMVFQNYALYENMTVYGNIAFPLKVRKESKASIKKKVTDIAQILKIDGLMDRRPGTLSGGEKQRVAMGRALVRDPKLFLMDEPLSNLDAQLRIKLREEIRRIQKTLKTTTIYVTHDQGEAMSMADRVVVMKDGRIYQADTPQNVYDNPADPFVGRFFGNTPMNIWEEGHKIYGIRPEDVLIIQDDCRHKEVFATVLKADVKEQYFIGNIYMTEVTAGGLDLTLCSVSALNPGRTITIGLPERKLHCWDKADDKKKGGDYEQKK